MTGALRTFYGIFTTLLRQSLSGLFRPAADAPACCGVTGHSDEREGHFGAFCPVEGVSGSVSFSQHLDSWRALRRSPERHLGRAFS